MDVGLLCVTLLLTVVLETELKYIELCKFEYRSNCRYNWYDCDKHSLYCYNAMIECDEWTTINILDVEYGALYNAYYYNYCPHACNSGLRYSYVDTRRLMAFCNKKQVCNLRQWQTNDYWKLHVIYDCQERAILPKTSINRMSTAHIRHTSKIPTEKASPRDVTTPFQYTINMKTTTVKSRTEAAKTQVSTKLPQPPQTITPSNVAESKTNVNNSPGYYNQFPVPAVVASLVGVSVLVIVLIVVVCMKRRRTIKSNQQDETILQMQIVANNSYGFSPPSVNTEDRQETEEHAYVDINLQNATDTADCTFEHAYVNTDKVVNTNDEYNTLNTRPIPFRIDPNYDHMPKGSHTTVDETYSHITYVETAMTDSTYSHLKDTKSATSRNAQSNQNNSDNVYNHINTIQMEESVYNNSQACLDNSLTSHLGKTRATEDDYDHTDWKQTNTNNSKSKNSNNEAVRKLETSDKPERAKDENAVVKRRSDKVECNDGHNYFVLEKQFL